MKIGSTPRRTLESLPAIVLLSVAAAGCGWADGRAAAVPDSTMVEIFMELHLIRARTAMDLGTLPGGEGSVLARYGVSNEDFRATMDRYVKYPDEYSGVLSQVVDRLTDERHRQGLPGASFAPPVALDHTPSVQDGRGSH